MRSVLQSIVILLVGALALVSVLPTLNTDYWVVRMADFPRLQILVLLGIVTAVALLVLWDRRLLVLVLVGVSGAAAATHAIVLWPYRPGHGELLGECADENRVSVMVVNVLAKNRVAEPLIRLVERVNPDLFLAMETDEWWDEALAPIASFMPHTLSEIQNGFFGLHLFSRLPLHDTEVRFLAGQDTPSLHADLPLGDGSEVRFVGMHPRPPQPFQSSKPRDAQLFAAGLAMRDEEGAYVVAGDLNATPWEDATERLKRIARLVDPRYGFGYVATYNAHSWWQRWPIDQVLHSPELVPVSVERLPDVGSDHFPYQVTLCHGAEPIGKPPALQSGDVEFANTTLDSVLEAAGE